MCGIAGFASPDPHAPSPERLAEGIKHRGPDGAGQRRAEFTGGSWTLFHSRLAIVDLSEAGAQPMADETGEWIMIFNGEIYNHQELRQRCQARGHRFSSAMDGEVILHLWEDEGERALERLNGIFALAIANTRTGEIVLARDPLGVKPVFYSAGPDGSLWFASEIAALRGAGAPTGSNDVLAIAQFLTFLWIPDPRTPFTGIHSLTPGHVLRWMPGSGVTASYGRPLIPSADRVDSDPSRAAAAIREQLRTAVDRQLLGDVPIGLMASGGVDSSLIWWAGQGAIARGYTVAWPREEGGERLDQDAAAVATISRQLGTDVDFLNGHDAAASHLPASGDLFADPAYELTRLIASRARQDGFKVLLSGQGADELFAGYRRHAIAPVLKRLRLGATGRIAGEVLARLAVRRVELEYLARTARASQHSDPFHRYMQLCSYSSATDRARILDCTEAEVSDAAVWQRHRAVYDSQPVQLSFLRRLLAVDRSVYLPGLGLAYVDRAGMEFGVEIRVPWLDLELIRWSLALPEPLLIVRARGKALPRHLAAEALGPQVAHRPKRGFAAPMSAMTIARRGLQRGIRQPLYLAAASRLLTQYLADQPGTAN